MPHISKHPIKKDARQRLEKHLTSLLGENKSQRRQEVLHELLTGTELVMLAKRLGAIFLIEKNTPTHDISEALKMSPSTIARFELAYERGRYKETLKWLHARHIQKGFFEILLDLAIVPFEAQHKSLNRMILERET